MGYYSILVPEAGTNLILNPSAETTGNFGDHNGGTTTRVTTYARFGVYCYQVATGAVNRGMTLTVAALANAIHYCTFYARGNAANTLQVSADNVNWNAVTVIGGAAGGWVRYGVSLPAAQCNGSTTIRIRNTANETFYIDGAQLEQASYYTTYIDGDQGPLYRWTGLRHGSTSTRDAQERLGGRKRDLSSDYNINVLPATNKIGMPPIQNNTQGQALRPGAVFESYKVLPRAVDLHLSLGGSSGPSSLSNLHALRKALIDLIKPDAYRGAQPFVLGYTGADSSTEVFAAFRYAGGAELGNLRGFNESPVIRCLAVDPFWYEDNRETASLDFADSVASSAYGNRRTNGQWLALGSGFNGAVYAIAVDAQRGRVYFGGAFTTANGVTVNRVGYWTGSTFVAMDGGAGNNNVKALAIAPNGDVWVGGNFTTIGTGAAACKGLARWNIATGTWTAFNNATATFNDIAALAIDPSGNLYIGGSFTDWNGTANADHIAKYDGTNWTALGTGGDQAVYALLWSNDNLYAGGAFTLMGGVASTAYIARWNGSAWNALSSGANNTVNALAAYANGDIAAGGAFTTIGGVSASRIAIWNGASFTALGAGVNAVVDALCVTDTQLLLAAGLFTTAGGLSVADRLAGWNGTTWVHLDVDLPGTPDVRAFKAVGSDLYIGYDTTGTATAAGRTTVTPTATALVYPEATLIGPTSASCTLQWLENQSQDERQYYNLTVQAGETIRIVTDPETAQVISDWRGEITNQPFSNSDDLTLLPGANTVAAFITGTTTGVSLLLHWQPRHWAVDGAA
jgi:hypothetical protein